MTEGFDPTVYRRNVDHLRDNAVVLPTFAQLADPSQIPSSVATTIAGVDPDTADALNLFRVHWYNSADRRERVEVPGHIVLPESLTGVPARIIVALGNRFPMIHAHKVLPAYACLVPRIVTGQFDATRQRALWPSTGNYCRGGVAISRILGCRGVAILPEGMSAERFEWLDRWVVDSSDIVRTPGSESNVKEIYDCCDSLRRDPDNVVLNQFSEFANHFAHYQSTGRALEAAFGQQQSEHAGLRLAAFVSASGSAGTLGAGDYLKEQHDAKIVAVEALECPTMLYNGFGEHNIQGIGDKHIPFIHNVTNTDIVTAVSDRDTDGLNVVFNCDAGREFLRRERGVDDTTVGALGSFGLSSICNVLAAVKTARRLGLGKDDAVLTVATDGAELYDSEREAVLAQRYPGGFDRADAAAIYERALGGTDTDHLLELTDHDRDRIFNLGYFTWVEQRGVSLEDFEKRRSQDYWVNLRPLLSEWDHAIVEFNAQTAGSGS